MRLRYSVPLFWIVTWFAISALGAAWLAQSALDSLRQTFETDARIAHRLLSQRVVQHDAVLATLVLGSARDDTSAASEHITAVYPQIVAAANRTPGTQWPESVLADAEAESRKLHRATLAGLDLVRGRYWLVLADNSTSRALQIDIQKMVPWNEWPAGATHIELHHDRQIRVLQPGIVHTGGWRFDFSKHLAAVSQPFDVVAYRSVGWGDLPWLPMTLWSVAAAAALAGIAALQRQRVGRRRAEELLRLGQVARLNTLGELAAGLAHELNQPLTAILANCQAANRLLADDEPQLQTVRDALVQAVAQAKRAAAVLTRLRNAVERPNEASQACALRLTEAINNALYLLEPEFRGHQVVPIQTDAASTVTVYADPVALEQIIHNLLINALQALEQVPVNERTLQIGVSDNGGKGILTIADSGPGIAEAAFPHLFEPFFTTRADGLGLGLTLCETLAGSLDGQLTAANRMPRGAVFTLSLPLANTL